MHDIDIKTYQPSSSYPLTTSQNAFKKTDYFNGHTKKGDFMFSVRPVIHNIVKIYAMDDGSC